MSAEHRKLLEEAAAASFAATRARTPGGTRVEDFLAVAVPRMVAATVDAEHYLRPPRQPDVAEVGGTPSESDGVTIAVGPAGNPHTVFRLEYPMRMSDPAIIAALQQAVDRSF